VAERMARRKTSFDFDAIHASRLAPTSSLSDASEAGRTGVAPACWPVLRAEAGRRTAVGNPWCIRHVRQTTDWAGWPSTIWSDRGRGLNLARAAADPIILAASNFIGLRMGRHIDQDQHEFDGVGAARWSRDHDGRPLDVFGFVQRLGFDWPRSSRDP
jgi:hypothetical protein